MTNELDTWQAIGIACGAFFTGVCGFFGLKLKLKSKPTQSGSELERIRAQVVLHEEKLIILIENVKVVQAQLSEIKTSSRSDNDIIFDKLDAVRADIERVKGRMEK